jgi:CRISPR-associated protein Cmr2
MTEHLLALSVGPVQEFISAARRTRDLWFGSYLLSEISKSAARAVRQCGGELIFPAPAGDLDLEPDSELNVANIILAKLSGPDPKAVAHKAKEAARKRWRQFADPVFMDYQAKIRAEIWQNQVDDVIEFYAAWVSHRPDLYSDDRARLMRLLAGRKNCRDFQPAKGYAGIPKSSLDGLRESVLSKAQKDESGRSGLRRLLRLADGEQLCAVGLVKRMAGGNPAYPSVARVAADPWIRGVWGENLRSLVDECERINRFNSPDVIRRLDTSPKRGHPHYSSFPFEGTVVYRSRHRELREEAAITEGDLQPLSAALGRLIKQAGEPREPREPREPSPYLGILVADGDRMGEALSSLKNAKAHQQFSRQLSSFAGEARRIVHDDHYGVLVYSGGDDVLAFVPVDQCLKCARALREKFSDLLQDESAKTETKLTLSVGLAIAHFMENLEDLLEYGRRAEKHAKHPKPEDGEQEDRDGLAVHLYKRGGGPVTMRANWSARDLDALDDRLAKLAAWLNASAIPHRVATDLHQIARVYDAWPSGSVEAAIQSDTLRVLAAKQPRGVSAMDQVRQLIDRRVHDAASLRRLGDELLVARLIAEAMRQAGGQAISGQTADEEASR